MDGMDEADKTSKGEANRQRIVEAANDLFYQQGFNKTSFAEIATASGIPKGNFYYYFKSKEALLDAVIAHRLAIIRRLLARWEEEIPEPRARLKRLAHILHHETDNIVRWGCPMGSLNTELGKTDPGMKQEAARMFDLYIDWAERQLRALGKGDEARALARHLLAMAQGAATLGHVYGDAAVLRQEEALINRWVDSL